MWIICSEIIATKVYGENVMSLYYAGAPGSAAAASRRDHSLDRNVLQDVENSRPPIAGPSPSPRPGSSTRRSDFAPAACASRITGATEAEKASACPRLAAGPATIEVARLASHLANDWTLNSDVKRSRSRRCTSHLALECRAIADGLSFVHVMISLDLAIGNAAALG